jgi:PAS domain S-box-containing protein
MKRGALSILGCVVPAIGVIALGAASIVAWLGPRPAWLVPLPGVSALVFSTAAGLVVAGIGLLAADIASPRARRVRAACAWILVLLAILAGLEHAFEFSLLDWRSLHVLADPANTTPGRMSIPTAAAFLVTGILLLVFDRPKKRFPAVLVQALAGMLLVIAVVSLITWDIPAEGLLETYRWSRMPAPIAVAFIAIGAALLTLIARSRWYVAVYADHADEKILIVTVSIFTLVFLAIAAAAFAAMEREFRRVVEGALSQAVQDRSAILESVLVNRVTRAAIVATRPTLRDALSRWGTGEDATLSKRIGEEGSSYLQLGFRGLAFSDEHGQRIATLGRIAEAPRLQTPIHNVPAIAGLLWDDGFIFRVHTPVYRGNEWVGTVVTDQELDLFSRLQLDVKELGRSAEWVLCAAEQRDLKCFPQRFDPDPRVSARSEGTVPLPVERALDGERGVVHAHDYRGTPVIAGYAPVGRTGLGVVLKLHANEFYAPLRKRLVEWSLWSTALALIGALLVTAQVRPVARRMVRSERVARERARALLRSENSMRALFDSLGDGIVMFKPDGTIEFLNPAAEAIFGYPEGELVGKPVGVLMTAQLRAANLQATRDFLATGASGVIGKSGLVFPAVRRDGTQLDVEFSLAEMRGESGTRLVGVVRDVSERTALERMKSEFVATVSHELRTPLTSIVGSLELLRESEMPEMEKSFLDMAWRNSKRLAALVNDVIDSERIESGALKFNVTRFALAPFLKEAVQINQPYASQHEVFFYLEEPVPEATLEADRDRLMQVIANLLSNAAKFSPPGEEVRVRAEATGTRVKIQVIDRGRGIPDEFRPRIFQKFSQADSSDTREKGGTGLGLAICKSIVQRLNGRIDFESTLGQGSTFFIELPAGAPAGSPSPAAVS